MLPRDGPPNEKRGNHQNFLLQTRSDVQISSYFWGAPQKGTKITEYSSQFDTLAKIQGIPVQNFGRAAASSAPPVHPSLYSARLTKR